MNDRPYGLLAELTYRCPLHCPYCSNPVNLAEFGDELRRDEWTRVLGEARELGVLQLHLSGGEPLQQRDLLDIVAEARRLGFYMNLITSALSLTLEKAEQLKTAGLDNVQISIQAADPQLSDHIAGTPSYHRKVAAARAVKALGFPLTLNCVLHRHNIDQVPVLIELAEELGADRVELANTQYYGWALHNRAALMPTRAQLEGIEPVVRAAIDRLAGRMQILYVFPDYYSQYPKPCMGGWGSRQLTLRPNGDVLPCQAADQIPGLSIENVRHRSLEWIWDESGMFNRFRGLDWMQEPCRSCPRKAIDDAPRSWALHGRPRARSNATRKRSVSSMVAPGATPSNSSVVAEKRYAASPARIASGWAVTLSQSWTTCNRWSPSAGFPTTNPHGQSRLVS